MMNARASSFICKEKRRLSPPLILQLICSLISVAIIEIDICISVSCCDFYGCIARHIPYCLILPNIHIRIATSVMNLKLAVVPSQREASNLKPCWSIKTTIEVVSKKAIEISITIVTVTDKTIVVTTICIVSPRIPNTMMVMVVMTMTKIAVVMMVSTVMSWRWWSSVPMAPWIVISWATLPWSITPWRS